MVKRRQGLKQESLIHFTEQAYIRLSLSGNPKHLAQTLGITLQAKKDHEDFLYSLRKWWSNIVVVEYYYYWWMMFRGLLRSWSSWCMWESGEVASVEVLLVESAVVCWSDVSSHWFLMNACAQLLLL
jgi:hypothetical protein